jgi:hypothetical protein
MINRTVQNASMHPLRAKAGLAILALWMSGAASLAQAQQSVQPRFSSATEACHSLFQAVESDNEQAIADLLGVPLEPASVRTQEQDKVEHQLFVEKYKEMHRLSRQADGASVLYLGAENWPFPVPLVNENGAWRFDSEAGKREVMFRRIGENELVALANCHEFAAAEKSYRPESADPANSLPTSLAAKAASGSTSADPVLFQGYYFRLLRAAKSETSGPVVLIAYPAEYRSSGVRTFVVGENGTVYQRDLGPNTSTLASAMTTFRKDATWQPAW